jgi:sugar lactone lactonase YvrE
MHVGLAILNRSGLVVLGCGLLVLAGCSGGSVGGLNQTGALPAVATKAVAGTKPGAKLSGSVHGGQQPIAGASVYLFAAGTTGYGSASVSLLTSGSGPDLNGNYYATTAADGSFSISGNYTCSQNSQVYLYSVGGNPGAGINSSAGLMAVLGNCPVAGNFMATVPFLSIDEVTTVAAAYAMAGFAVDATDVSSSGSALAQVGIANAFANAANLASLGTGAALTTTPAGNGTVPQAEINTLANILAACINSDGTVTGPSSPTACYTLFTNALSAGTTGTQPTDTATAAINIAHNPGANLASLYGLPLANPPFAPVLAVQPNDFTVALTFAAFDSPTGFDLPNIVAIDGAGDAWISSSDVNATSVLEISSASASPSGTSVYTGGGLVAPWGVAIDGSGDAWVTSTSGNSVTEFSSTGSFQGTFTGATMSGPTGIAIDGSGNAWIANSADNTISVISNAGADSSGPYGFFSTDMLGPTAIAIDGTSNAWIANSGGVSVTELSSGGGELSGAAGYTGVGLYAPASIAIDGAGDAWVASQYGNGALSAGGVTELTSTGAVITTLTSGGLQYPVGVAIDGAGNAWIADLSNAIIEFSNTGIALSGTSGYLTGSSNPPYGVAVDGSGDVWITIPQSNAVAELVGAGVPVVTPLAAGTANNALGTQP